MSLQIPCNFDTSHKDDAEQYSTPTFSESDSSKERILKSRCRSEKKRRDKLNLLISELRSMLCPGVESKKYDKATVLQMTVEYMKMHNDISFSDKSGHLQKSFFLPCEELGNLMLQILNGFIMAIDEEFKFVYVADSVYQVLGVKSSILEGKTVANLVHKEDQKNLHEMLQTHLRVKSRLNTISSKTENITQKKLEKFNFRILVSKDNCEPEYCFLSCVGGYSDYGKPDIDSPTKKVLLLMACLEMEEIHEVDSDAVLMFHAKHGLDGHFVDTDSSCTILTGYLPSELNGKSLYEFVHDDDISDVVRAHKQLTSNNSTSTEAVQVYFRFHTKGKDWALFKVQCQLVAKSNMQSSYITMCFNIARDKEIFHFRNFAKSESVQIQDVKKMSDPEKFKNVGGASFIKVKDVTPKTLWGHAQEEKIARDDGADCEKDDNDPNQKSWIDGSPSEPHPLKSDDTGLPITENVEQIFDAQKHLHEQLEGKHVKLSESLKKQKSQLETIGKIMNEYAYFMEAPSFKNHYKQQVEMLEYFQYLLKKQQRQQEYLQKQLKGKIKGLEIKQRAVKLRNIASQQQKTLSRIKEMRAEQQQKNPNKSRICDSAKSNASSHLLKQGQRLNVSELKTFSPQRCTSSNDMSYQMSFLELLNEPENRHTQTGGNRSHISTKNSGSDKEENDPIVQSNASRISNFRNSFEGGLSNNFVFPNHTGASSCSKEAQNARYNRENHATQSSGPFQLPQLSSQSPQLANQQIQLLNSLAALTQHGITHQGECSSNNTGSSKPVETANQGNNIQNVLANQILVHLQELQKHVLNQLQAVDHSKVKETESDFSQILPVLQQLQQLQASIIEQQTQKQTVNSQVEPLRMSTPTLSSSYTPSTTVNQSTLLSEINRDQDMFRTRDMIQRDVTGDTYNTNQSFDEKHSTPPSESVFGDLSARMKELDQIKESIFYKKQTSSDNEFSDCFSNLSSPELRSLMFGDTDDNKANTSDDHGNSDLKKDKDMKEDDTLQYFQPLLEDQQHLARMLQHQRMQILSQQQLELNSFRLDGQTLAEQRQPSDDTVNTSEVDFSTNITPFNFANDSDDETLNLLLNETDLFW